MTRHSILLVGPLPPPIDGRAVATGWLVDALRARGAPVTVIDTQIATTARRLRKAMRCASAAARVVVRPPSGLIVVASGSSGLLLELLPLLAASIRRVPADVVHHSASYVRSDSPAMRVLVALGGPLLVHVVLCREMGEELGERYAIGPDSWTVLDNIALYPEEARSLGRHERRVLHISNLSAEKGVRVVLDVARRLSLSGLGSCVTLAGPRNPSVAAALDSEHAAGRIQLVGAVEGRSKQAEFDRARVLLVPTSYHHEAQPLVIYEAIAHGVIPVAWGAGWIPEQMEQLGLASLVFGRDEVEETYAAVHGILTLPDAEFDDLSREARERFNSLRNQSSAQVEALLASLAQRSSSSRRGASGARVRSAGTCTHLLVWGSWGAYHYARYAAYRERAALEGVEVVGLEMFRSSTVYGWEPRTTAGVVSLDLGDDETAFPGLRRMQPALAHLWRLRPDVVFLPAYQHWSLLLNIAARLLGARVVIMHETTRATARPGRWRRIARTVALRTAHSVLVGGTPQRRYLLELGVRESRIFDGYNTIDNDFFASKADGAREEPGATRGRYDLPDQYFLAVARLVPKKSLDTLIAAYGEFRKDRREAPALVLIGSGPLQHDLEAQALSLGIALGRDGLTFVSSFDEERVAATMALATACVLPSVLEEWGLVVNEAMAAGCPVIASNAVGCAEDLLIHGETGLLFDPRDTRTLTEHLAAIADDPRLRDRMIAGARDRIARWGCDRFASQAQKALRP